MDDAFGVGGIEAVGNFDGEREQGFVVQRLAADQMLEGHAIEKLHGDEGLVAVLADFVDGADVGMVQGGGGAGFAAKALEGLRDRATDRRAEISGRRSGRVGVLGLVDHAHAAAAEFFDDAVVRDGLADHCWIVVDAGFRPIHLHQLAEARATATSKAVARRAAPHDWQKS